jgi:hypothetical protein
MEDDLRKKEEEKNGRQPTKIMDNNLKKSKVNKIEDNLKKMKKMKKTSKKIKIFS